MKVDIKSRLLWWDPS